MKYLKNIFYFLESITFYKIYSDWNIKFNHSSDHNLDDKLKRTNLNKNDFNKIINKVIDICKNEKLDGDWVFFSFKYECKIVTRVLNKNKTLYVITILGKDQKVKMTQKIKML